MLQPDFLRFQGLGSDFLVDAIGKFINVAVAVQVYDLLPSLQAFDEYLIQEMRLASVGSPDDLHHIVRVDRPFYFINIALNRLVGLLNPPLENGVEFDADLRLKVIRLGDDFLYGVEVLADDDLMIIGGLGNAVDVELVSTEEIFD